MTMWRRIVVLLCMTCQYQSAGSQRDADWKQHKFHGKNSEDLLTEFSDRVGIDEKAILSWLSSPASDWLLKNSIGTGGGNSGDDAETCDVCSGMGGGMDTRRRSSVDEDVS